MPKVMSAPIRLDVIRFVHDNVARNRLQAKGVSTDAGMQHSA